MEPELPVGLTWSEFISLYAKTHGKTSMAEKTAAWEEYKRESPKKSKSPKRSPRKSPERTRPWSVFPGDVQRIIASKLSPSGYTAMQRVSKSTKALTDPQLKRICSTPPSIREIAEELVDRMHTGTVKIEMVLWKVGDRRPKYIIKLARYRQRGSWISDIVLQTPNLPDRSYRKSHIQELSYDDTLADQIAKWLKIWMRPQDKYFVSPKNFVNILNRRESCKKGIQKYNKFRREATLNLFEEMLSPIIKKLTGKTVEEAFSSTREELERHLVGQLEQRVEAEEPELVEAEIATEIERYVSLMDLGFAYTWLVDKSLLAFMDTERPWFVSDILEGVRKHYLTYKGLFKRTQK